jgi:hypothetical protein
MSPQVEKRVIHVALFQHVEVVSVFSVVCNVLYGEETVWFRASEG